MKKKIQRHVLAQFHSEHRGYKPVHKTDHYPLWNAVSFFLFTTLEEKNKSNIVVSQAVRFLLYKN